MSVYQPVGDTVALTVLAYQLYKKGYSVAKHAPDEFRALLEELDVFKRTVWQVQRSLKNSNESLGEDIITICTNVLVKDFQPLVLKYEKLGAYSQSSAPFWADTKIEQLSPNADSTGFDGFNSQQIKMPSRRPIRGWIELKVHFRHGSP